MCPLYPPHFHLIHTKVALSEHKAECEREAKAESRTAAEEDALAAPLR